MDPRPDQLVGRETELDAIAAVLTARDTLPGGVLLEGAAGIGKSSLWQAGVDRATSAGYRVLTCRATGSEVNLLFGGLSDLLLDNVADVLPSLPGPQRRAINGVLLLDDDDQPTDQRAVGAGVLNVIRELASDEPVLIAIDDSQWLDPASALVIEYALRRLGDARVAVLATRRADPLAVSVGSGEHGLDLERSLERLVHLPIGPLKIGAIHRLLRTRTGREIPRALLRRIHEASGGNPFYALEIARAMTLPGHAWSAGDPLVVGGNLAELLTDRFRAFDGTTRAALFIVAAASQPSRSVVEAVLARPAAEVLEPAIVAGILTVDGERLGFSHPLLAAAADALTSPADRQRWHERLAAVSSDPEARARHLAIARPGVDLAVAETLHTAARESASRGAPAAAGELFAIAVERLPDDQLERRAAWAVEASRALWQAGDLRQGRALLESVVDELPGGPLRSDVLLALSRLVRGDPAGDARELELIDRALEDAGTDPGRRAAALLSREMWTRHQNRLAEALVLARQALALAERTDDTELVAGALTRTADLEVLVGLADEPVTHFARAVEAGASLYLDAREDSPRSMLAVCLVRVGRIAEARSLLVAEREAAIAHGDEASLEILCLFLAELEWLSGDWDRARDYAEEGLLVAEQADSRMMQGAIGGLIALLEGSRGDLAGARSRATAAAALCEEVGDLSYATYGHQMLGFLELSAGDPSTAHDHLARHIIEHEIEGPKRIAFVGDDIEALALLGRIDEAEHLADEVAARGELLHRPILLAAAARGRALILGARGDLDGASRMAERAVELTAPLGLPLELGRSLLILGDVKRRAKQRRAAREALTAAAEIFAGLGATLWWSRAADSLARVGGRVREPGLTATERQVAALVARGLTNKEVASELFVTVRAVEANLSRIYAKLEVRSRTELAGRL